MWFKKSIRRPEHSISASQIFEGEIVKCQNGILEVRVSFDNCPSWFDEVVMDKLMNAMKNKKISIRTPIIGSNREERIN